MDCLILTFSFNSNVNTSNSLDQSLTSFVLFILKLKEIFYFFEQYSIDTAMYV